MQRKNLLIWLVASALFVGGLYLLDKHVLPPPQPPEKKDEARGIGLGPEHDWSSHGADAFGLMCVAYEEPYESKPLRYPRVATV